MYITVSSLVHILTEVKLIKKIAQISTVWNTCRCTCMLKSGTTTCRILHYREKQDTVLLLSSEKYWKWDQQTSLQLVFIWWCNPGLIYWPPASHCWHSVAASGRRSQYTAAWSEDRPLPPCGHLAAVYPKVFYLL